MGWDTDICHGLRLSKNPGGCWMRHRAMQLLLVFDGGLRVDLQFNIKKIRWIIHDAI